ncbi:Bcr/CflA family efflux MFS transporter [Archangium primigenium]|uniref:Bcr/CflA family efflux MFS transporter n=1 Tax=[Archangium] primigenium TaxID=2792470 RepID=UPI00195A1A04|nr:multidrug effflux MFS transporter [Archangium primigenium]
MRIRPQSFVFTLLLGALSALPPFSIDMGLPALGLMAQSLGTTSAGASLSLSLFMVGFALGPLVYGPLSDRYGRRPLMLVGCGVFVAAGVGCALAGSLPVMLVCRFIQGAGAGAGSVLVMAIIRDLFEGAVARTRLSYVSLVMGVAPMIAPTIGAGVLAVSHWRAIYFTLAAGGLVLLLATAGGLQESAPRSQAPLSPRGLARSYARVFGHRLSLGYSLLSALSFGCCFAYISGSPLVLMDVLGVSTAVYGTCFALTALAMMAGAFANGRLSARGVPAARLLTLGLALGGLGSLLLVLVTGTGLASVATLLPLFALTNFSLGFITPNATHGALQPMPDIAGVASAVLNALRMLVAAASSALVAVLFQGTSALPVAVVMAGFALASVLVYVLVVRPVEHQAPPDTDALPTRA